MDYKKLHGWTEKDNFPMPFIDQMLDRLARKGWYYFLDGYSGHNQISIALKDQDKTLGHADIYWRLITNFSETTHPLCKLLENECKFILMILS